MKNLLKKLSPLLALVMVFTMCCAIAGCNKEEEKEFEFTDEVLAKIDDESLSREILQYCNDFYANFQKEVEIKLYIENDKISSTIGSQITDKINALALPYFLNGDEDGAKEIVKFFLPFTTLIGERSGEYLKTKFNFTTDAEGNSIKTPISPLTQTYIDNVNGQFDILKKDYFKK